MSDENVLTKEIAEQFLKDDGSVELGGFTSIEDDAADLLGNSGGEGKSLDLCGLQELGVNAAKNLAKFGGQFLLDMGNHSDEVSAEFSKASEDSILYLFGGSHIKKKTAEILSSYKGNLIIEEIELLDDDVAESLSNQTGTLTLGGLENLLAETCEIFSKYKGDYLCFSNLYELSPEGANHLSKYKGWLGLPALPRISQSTATALSQKSEGGIELGGLVSLGVSQRTSLENSAAEIEADFESLPLDDYDD